MKHRPQTRDTKLLRLLKKEAKKHGYKFVGLNGRSHYSFAKGDIVISCSFSPRSEDDAVNNFVKDMLRGGCRHAGREKFKTTQTQEGTPPNER